MHQALEKNVRLFLLFCHEIYKLDYEELLMFARKGTWRDDKEQGGRIFIWRYGKLSTQVHGYVIALARKYSRREPGSRENLFTSC